ncbi:MFS transporter [Nonomuraea sp. NPDC050790]|uniref:MFS transporter n=1 Tax=Nonomuraea sp. NPDC050790 TaxID=3364371 RepID=UPI0037A9281A
MADSTRGVQSGAARDSAWKRDFRLLWTGSAFSQFGTVNATLAAPLLALAQTGSPVFAGWVTAAGTLPRLFLYLPAGVIVDRSNRRAIMVISAFLQMALALVLVVGLLGRWDVTLLLPLVAGAQGVCAVFYSTAELAVVPRLVPEESLPKAMSRNEARIHGAGLLGRPFGGLLFDLMHGLPFLLDAISSALSAFFLLKMDKKAFKAPETHRSAMASDMREGVRFLRRDAFLFLVVIVCALANFFFQIVGLSLVLLAHALALPYWLTGVLIAASGFGGVLGSLVAPRFLRGRQPRAVIVVCVWAWLALSAALVVGDHGSVLYVAVLLPLVWGGIGFTGACLNVALSVHYAKEVPVRLHARVVSVSRFFSGGAVPLGALAAGYVIAGLGTHLAAVLVAGVILVLALAVSSGSLAWTLLVGLGLWKDRVAERVKLVLEAGAHRLRDALGALDLAVCRGPAQRFAERLQARVARAWAQWAQPGHRGLGGARAMPDLPDLFAQVGGVEARCAATAELLRVLNVHRQVHDGLGGGGEGLPELAVERVAPVAGPLLRGGEPGVPRAGPLGEDRGERAGQRAEHGGARRDDGNDDDVVQGSSDKRVAVPC